ncbi:GNAT family N-acetyltransferase [Alteribacter populi]|uniref:GNAT family N-acetyltransferase n=1 Tax=Alteribacter populi TaxID=2011011 RepID=UPI000BBA670D|nr:GNAT family N-acetyltransferase [Alteribacter populi]
MEQRTKRLKLISCTLELIEQIEDDYPCGEHMTDFLKKLEEDAAIDGWGPWVVFQNGKAIGDIGFKGEPTPIGTVEIGYGFMTDFRNKGYATEGVKALIEWAFQNERVEKVLAECAVDNVPSIRVLEKLGFDVFVEKDGMIYWELKG